MAADVGTRHHVAHRRSELQVGADRRQRRLAGEGRLDGAQVQHDVVGAQGGVGIDGGAKDLNAHFCGVYVLKTFYVKKYVSLLKKK